MDSVITPTSPTSSPTPAGPPLMRAVTRRRYGGSDVMELAELPRPGVGAGDVLVRVHAAGLDRGTEHLMTGKPYAMRLGFGVRRPRNPVLGRDVAGTVAHVGAAVSRFAVGDEVYGVAPGAFAEYAVAREDRLASKPANLTFAQAAAVPISAGTALQALRDAGRIQAGQTVLVLGASGGVGSYAVQLAKAFGAEVTGSASTAKLDLVASLGADHVLDHSSTDFAEAGRRYDLVLDIGGSPSLRRLRRVLRPRGTAVFVGSEQGGSLTGMGRQLRGALLSPFVPQRLALCVSRERAADYELLATMIEAGQLVPSVGHVFPLERAHEAMGLLERGEVRGKVAITVIEEARH